MKISLPIAALLASAVSISASATPVVDQSNAVVNISYCTVSCTLQQTITAGLSGKLTGLTLFGSGTGEIRVAKGSGYFTGPWSADIANAVINGTVIDLSSYNIFVTAGEQIVFDVSSHGGDVNGSNTTPVVGSLYETETSGITEYSQYGLQLGYVTYVDTDASDVPEPAMLGLFGTGAVAVGLSRRRKAV